MHKSDAIKYLNLLLVMSPADLERELADRSSANNHAMAALCEWVLSYVRLVTK